MTSLIEAGPLLWDVESPCGEGPDGTDASQWARAQALAVEWVWALSGRKYGLRSVVFRPEWTTPVAGHHHRSHLPVRSPLPGPVDEISEVLVDGQVLDPAAWQQQGDDLVRIDGHAWYPFQNVGHPTTEVGTWQVTYLRGVSVPESGQWAVGTLACELLKAIQGEKCRLPSNVQTVARNGVSISLDAKQLQLGFTTLTDVDQWCRMVNPKQHQSDPCVWSPDLDPSMLPPIHSHHHFAP